ncbi:MAG TPA: Sec-independent protein translocase protein TatB [Dehalococcoidia bacterium]|nr:Sec-independent protein translocase protein TatB [Dehalococcoidia bacterium]
MDFLGVGLPEILLVLLVALVVVGPQRLPQVAIEIAKVVKTLRGYATEVTNELKGEFEEFTQDYGEVKAQMQDLRNTINSESSAITREADDVVQESRLPAVSGPIIETTSAPAPPPSNGATGGPPPHEHDHDHPELQH